MSHGHSAHGDNDKAGDIPLLNSVNWNQWQFRMKARFRKRGVWTLVEGKRPQPSPLPTTATAEEKEARQKLMESWENDCAFAAGDLVLALDETQQVHVDGIDDDPVAMWQVLSAQHAQKKPGTRINALGDLLFAKKQPDETLQAFQGRVNGYRQRFHGLRDTDYGLDKLEDELEIMASLRGLPSDYEVLKQSLSLSATLTLTDLRQAFASKDTEENDSMPTALYTAAPALPAILPTATPSNKYCVFHKTSSHSTDECEAVKQLAKEHQENRKPQRFGGRSPSQGQTANATLEVTQLPLI